jgi:hypothetical protein
MIDSQHLAAEKQMKSREQKSPHSNAFCICEWGKADETRKAAGCWHRIGLGLMREEHEEK